jgi:regulator of ribosome biosynthesis
MQYDEATGEWVPKWGYKGANKAGENDWIVEVDEKKERELKGKGGEETGVRGVGRRERKERVKRGERLMRANERRARNGGI